MKAQVVSFHCVLKNALGTVINTSFSRDVITHADGVAAAIPGLPAGMANVKPGERRSVAVKAQEAFGVYDPALTRQVPSHRLGRRSSVTVGDQVRVSDDEGNLRAYRVTGIFADTVFLDANHPLAGQDLVFDLHILEARDASPEELLESSAPANEMRLH